MTGLDAGHGTQVQDKDGDEEDGYDEGNGTILVLDMEQETRAIPTKSQILGPMTRGAVSSRPSLILKMRFCRSAGGSILPVGNILELPELANVKSSDEPVTPGAERGPISASDSVVLEMKRIESPVEKRVYKPIAANVVSSSFHFVRIHANSIYHMVLTNQSNGTLRLAGTSVIHIQCLPSDNKSRTGRAYAPPTLFLIQAFTTGLRGAAAKYNAMPGGFHPEQRVATDAVPGNSQGTGTVSIHGAQGQIRGDPPLVSGSTGAIILLFNNISQKHTATYQLNTFYTHACPAALDICFDAARPILSPWLFDKPECSKRPLELNYREKLTAHYSADRTQSSAVRASSSRFAMKALNFEMTSYAWLQARSWGLDLMPEFLNPNSPGKTHVIYTPCTFGGMCKIEQYMLGASKIEVM
ncbi:hypothetical protein AG1IA_07396 [Rhizoctonia solani AG-1 IA]|uniref:Uncharacterized protein n=1 Tax=Thanatephorus cucumeris (strain AG1-IA) TaxID=983506 RepID=L8WP75_THACA|nr:hypothetical protein AG1IA_07396 [Rhizoctonia solani AG-1 IA]